MAFLHVRLVSEKSLVAVVVVVVVVVVVLSKF